MTTTAVKPWTGTGAVNAWTVTGTYFETRTQANYGTGNACGLEYKGLVTNNPLTSAMIETTNGITVTGHRAITSTAGRSRPSHWAVPARPASAASQKTGLDQGAVQ